MGHIHVTWAKGGDISSLVTLRPLTYLYPHPGSYFHNQDWQEAKNGRFLLLVPDAQPSSSGIYSATYLEASPLGSAFFRLIVRGQRQRQRLG